MPFSYMDYLNHDPLHHMDILEALRRNIAVVLAQRDDGLLIKMNGSRLCMLSAATPAAAKALLTQAPKGMDMLATHQAFISPLAQKLFGFCVKIECLQAIYLGKTPLPLQNKQLIIHPLAPAHLQVVVKEYSHPQNTAYIEERLAAGCLWGGYLNGQMAGFIGQHEEGSLGMLEVFPAYRRQCVGATLQAFLTNWQLQQGYTPYAQVETKNTASLSLQQKLGFTLAKKHIYWLEA